MFFDERIIIQKGKIFRKLNVLAIIFTFVYLVCRLFIYSSQKIPINFGLFTTELFTITASLVILLIGELCFKTNNDDERIITNKFEFYNKSGKRLLLSIIVGYAISMIFFDNRSIYDFPTNDIIIISELLFVVYLYYQFKKNNININYSFIDNYNSKYYLKVFKNIGIFALVTIAIYAVTGCISTLVHQNPNVLISFLIAAIISIISLGGHYLLLSFIEKVDYDDQLNEIKNSFKIVTIVVCVLSTIHIIASVINRNLTLENVSNNLQTISITSEIMHNVSIINLTYIGIYCSYLLSYFKDNTVLGKAIITYIIALLLITIVTVILDTATQISYFNLSLDQYMVTKHAYRTLKNLLTVKHILEAISIIIYGNIVLLLIKEKNYLFYLIILPVVILISFILVVVITDAKDNILKLLNIFYEFFKLAQWGVLSFVLIKEIKNK